MAGSIVVSGTFWTAAGSLFDWIIGRIALNSPDDLAKALREIVDEHFEWLSLEELSPQHQVIVRRWLCQNLMPEAEAYLDLTQVDREKLLAHLRELRRLACSEL